LGHERHKQREETLPVIYEGGKAMTEQDKTQLWVIAGIDQLFGDRYVGEELFQTWQEAQERCTRMEYPITLQEAEQ